jgi:hypothetical protein
MKLISDEKSKMLAEKNGWSIARARGYIDGENFRRLGTVPSTYALVGIDDYGLGFRAGYFERTDSRLTRSIKSRPAAAHISSDESPQAVSGMS